MSSIAVPVLVYTPVLKPAHKHYMTCRLFKQRNIPQELKLQNLTSLINSSLKCSATAEFSDLEAAIIAHSQTSNSSATECEESATSTVTESEVPSSPTCEPEPLVDSTVDDSVTTSLTADPRKIKPGVFVAGLFDDSQGFFISVRY